MKLLSSACLAALLASAAAAHAHQGHGMTDVSHWHASDSAGFLVLALALGLLWWGRRK